jgi:hypothetical protein
VGVAARVRVPALRQCDLQGGHAHGASKEGGLKGTNLTPVSWHIIVNTTPHLTCE